MKKIKKEKKKIKKKKEEKIKKKKDYEETRIEIKNSFIPKKKYEKGNYYDIIIKMNLLNELAMDGWEIDYSPEFNFEKENIIPVSVIGEGNRGKSYLLGKITGYELPQGFSEKTEGISVKYLLTEQTNQQYKIALLDSAGGQTPIIKSEKYDEYFSNLYKDLKIKELKKKYEKNNDKTNEEELLKNIEEIKNKKFGVEIIKNEDENAYNECLKKLILDKSLTEQFIKDFALSKSKVILLVVGQLTISEQLFINNLKDNITEDKKIIIIHNLLNFVKKKQVEDYINDVLKRSLFFNLEEIPFTEWGEENEDNKNQKESDINKIYYREIFESLEGKIKITIIHVIFANDSKESEAGNYYNYSTINIIKTNIIAVSSPKKFDVVEELREYLIEKSYKYLDKNTKDTSNKNNKKSNEKNQIFSINENNLIIEESKEINQKENKSKKYIMKLKDISNLSLKKIITDETGKFKYAGNAFVPTYFYYTDIVKRSSLDEECKDEKDVEVFVIVIELAGKIENLREKINPMKNGKFLISIWGEKKLSDITDISYLYSDLDENEFRIEFEINMDECNINPKLKKSTKGNGIIKFYYELKTKDENEEQKIIIQPGEKKKTNEKGKENNKNNEEKKKKSQIVQDKNNEEKNDLKKEKKEKKESDKNNENVKKKK